jgi:MFS family permease
MKKTVLFVSAVGAFLTPFMASAVNVALPRIGREFALNTVTLSWFAIAYILASAAFLLPFGKIADLYGRKKIYSIGTMTYSAASLLVCVAPDMPALLAFRVIQGAGAAMIFGTGVAMLTSVYPPEERGKALGINVSAVYLGLSLGPLVGGLLTVHFGWRSIFIVSAAMGAFVWGLLAWKVRAEWKEPHGEGLDWTGCGIYVVSLSVMMIGFSKLPSAAGAACSIGGALGIAGFIGWESKSPHPVLNVSLLRHNRVFAFSNLAALINYSATSAVSFLLSLYLQYVRALNPREAGLVLVAQPAVMALLSPAMGGLSDRVESRVLASAGMGFCCAGLLLLFTVGENTGLPWIVFCLLVLGFGFALFSSPNTNAVMGAVERRHYGVASATLGTMRLVGQMLSMGFAVLLFALFMGKASVTPDNHPAFISSVKTAFLIFAVLCGAGVFASLARGGKGIAQGGSPRL